MKHLVIIGTVFPEPNSTAAGKRMLQLIDFFINENYSITFLSAANFSENSFDLSSLNIATEIIKLNDADFEENFKKLNADVVLFDRFTTEEQFGWKVSQIAPNALKILDTEDLHFLRKAREVAFKQNRILQESDLISDVFKREMASILRCDLSLIISEYEMNILTEKFKVNNNILFYLPIFAESKPSKVPFSERKNFISIGNFLHEPNWQTILKLKNIWPKIRKRISDAELHIFGAYASEKAMQLHNEKEKFLIKGRAESVEKIFEKARVLLAPIPFGAGIKGKLLESMQFGLPTVTTEIGAEGMHQNLDWNGFIAENDDDFIDQSILLYQDEKIWEKSQKKGFEIIENLFNRDRFISVFSEKINFLIKNLEQHREDNFLGQILQHHTLQSSKYLGKWIEEKNRKL